MAKTPAPDRRPLFANQKAAKKRVAVEDKSDIAAGMAALKEPTVGTWEDVRTLIGITGAGTLVGVRLQPKLLKKLDKHRGGQTRPQAIREILEKYL